MNRRKFFVTGVVGLLAAKLGIKVRPAYGLRTEINPYKPYVPKGSLPLESIPFYTNEILLQDEQVIQDILNIRMDEASQYARDCFAQSLFKERANEYRSD